MNDGDFNILLTLNSFTLLINLIVTYNIQHNEKTCGHTTKTKCIHETEDLYDMILNSDDIELPHYLVRRSFIM